MIEQKKRVDMRASMPETAEWIERKRSELGREHVNDCIRRAMAGEPGHFYAMENGHVLGVPFPSVHPMAEMQDYAVLCGVTFAGFMREPGDTHGAH